MKVVTELLLKEAIVVNPIRLGGGSCFDCAENLSIASWNYLKIYHYTTCFLSGTVKEL
jgi:hypothetical protein